eukprot:PhF_6_TR43361/c0_g1_i3/m.66454
MSIQQQVLFRSVYGSILYGTNTPTSDVDYIQVYLPPLNTILQAHAFSTKTNMTHSSELDVTSYPIHVFARDLYRGTQQAVEVAFAVLGNPKAADAPPLYHDFLSELTKNYLVRNDLSFPNISGWLVRGNAKKTLGEIGLVLEKLAPWATDSRLLVTLLAEDKVFSEFSQSCAPLTQDKPGKHTFLTVHDKLFDVHKVRVEHVVAALKKTYDRLMVEDQEPVNWKGWMHTIRVQWEENELLRGNTLTFPHDADMVRRLLEIRSGAVPLIECAKQLKALADEKETLLKHTAFAVQRSPELDVSFNQWLAGWIARWYDIPSTKLLNDFAQPKVLFSSLHGSKLYGTATPESDTDIHSVVLPSLSSLLVGVDVKLVITHSNNAYGIQNTAEDSDTTLLPFMQFASDVFSGQQHAVELAFAVHNGTHARLYLAPTPFGEMFETFVSELLEMFLPRELGFQKTKLAWLIDVMQRRRNLQEVEVLRKFFDPYSDVNPKTRLSELLETQPAFREGIRTLNLPLTVVSDKLTTLQVMDKTFNVAKIPTGEVSKMLRCASDRLRGVIPNPAKQWKAWMHVYRAVVEETQLLRGTPLVYPHPPELKRVLTLLRNGDVGMDEFEGMVLQVAKEVEEAFKETKRPTMESVSERFQDWLIGWVRKFYGL